MGTTVTDLLALLAEGESRTFEPANLGCVEDQFFSVHNSYEYSPQIEWRNPPSFNQLPTPNFRHGPGRSIFSIDEQKLSFLGPASDLVDYCWSNGSHFASDRLANVIEQVDPASIDRRAISVQTSDGIVPFNAVMPRRALDAVDTNKTRVKFDAELFVTKWMVSIYFPDGIVFNYDCLVDIENFCQIDTRQWCWSRKLIDAAKNAGIRGLYTSLPSTFGTQIDSL